jgi:hypothetical protein
MPAIPGTARQDRPVQGGYPGTTAHLPLRVIVFLG